jgi:nicotinamidase-related amidase
MIIDVQKAYFKPGSVESRTLESAAGYINAASELFRNKNLPVIVIQHIDEDEGVVPGSKKFEVYGLIQVLPTDTHIHKTYGNAFNKTPLKSMLDSFGIDTVLLTGFCAEYCVLSTYRGAMDLDLTPIIIRDSLASGVAENTIFFGALKKILG